MGQTMKFLNLFIPSYNLMKRQGSPCQSFSSFNADYSKNYHHHSTTTFYWALAMCRALRDMIYVPGFLWIMQCILKKFKSNIFYVKNYVIHMTYYFLTLKQPNKLSTWFLHLQMRKAESFATGPRVSGSPGSLPQRWWWNPST